MGFLEISEARNRKMLSLKHNCIYKTKVPKNL